MVLGQVCCANVANGLLSLTRVKRVCCPWSSVTHDAFSCLGPVTSPHLAHPFRLFSCCSVTCRPLRGCLAQKHSLFPSNTICELSGWNTSLVAVSSPHEASELETSVLYCVASLTMSLAAVFVLSLLFQETCVLSRALNSLEAIVVPHGQQSVLVPVCDKDEVTVHPSLWCQKYSFLGQR